MDIADKIRYLRLNILNLGQEKFAQKINVTRSTIKNWENGSSKPTTAHIMMISLLCEVTTDYLVFDDHPFELSLNGIGKSEYALLQNIIVYFQDKNSLNKEGRYEKNDL